MKILHTQTHTIFMTVGPSGSGKTTFVNNVLKPSLEKCKPKKPNIQYIGSDDIRRSLIGEDLDKFDNRMSEVSEQAFDILFSRLNAVTSYPVNAEFVVLDTTGLNEDFRNKVLAVAEKNHYNVDVILFDYKSVDEYKRGFDSSDHDDAVTGGRIIANHMKRLKTNTLKTLQKRKYKNVHKIKNKDFLKKTYYETAGVASFEALEPTIDFVVRDYDRYSSSFLPNYNWITFGDIHGCFNEFIELLEKNDFKIENNKITGADGNGIIIAGDFIDKSSDEDIRKTIDFLHTNKAHLGDRLQLIIGNHEEMVWKWITDHPSLEKTEIRLKEKENYYNTSILLESDEVLKNKFLELFKQTKGWVKFSNGNEKTFIVTHAPCEIKYLEKMDSIAYKKQYKSESRSKNKDKTNDDLTPYLKLEANKNHPFHIFGHMGQSGVRSFKNKICIDSGCVYGNALTSIEINYGKFLTKNVQSKQACGKNDYNTPLFSFESHNEEIMKLDEKQERIIDNMIDNGIEYLSGTMCPADKDDEHNTLESLSSGLDYFKSHVDSVVLQPKYMGSRAQLYLTDSDTSFAVSRNGYKIKTDISSVINRSISKYSSLFEKYNAKTIIFDGELLPWSAIGKGLIEDKFTNLGLMAHNEIESLIDLDFNKHLADLIDKYNKTDFDTDKNNMSKAELIKKYGHDYNNFKNIYFDTEYLNQLDNHIHAIKLFNEQVDIYGSEDELEYKAFRILKIITNDGKVIIPKMIPSEQFNLINNDDCFIVDFNSDTYLSDTQKWYDNLTINQKMEGCVIKPDILEKPYWLAPFIKVRNPDYLTIIYGYDMYFDKKYKKLIRSKKINKKLKLSISEYNLGEELLKLDKHDPQFKNTLSKIMFEWHKETDIDPRL